ncbi:hypothetical protein [Roseobacter sp. HKCCA0434]|uniref:hypothetical protein n=1 Tax=Roseobacter sp. HKCCA0434 TaxID=3079297 RepID=UPI0029058430|nr:hypothetical protein [Roseobacter sp. HKCCA0434]
MPRNPFDPFNVIPLWSLQQKAALSAMQTIQSRVGLMARGAMTPVEATAMWAEKPAAFAVGYQDAAMAFARGEGMSAILQAGLAPVAKASGDNAKRLGRRR